MTQEDINKKADAYLSGGAEAMKQERIEQEGKSARVSAEAKRDALWAVEYERAAQSGLPEETAREIADTAVAGWAMRLGLSVMKKHFPT